MNPAPNSTPEEKPTMHIYLDNRLIAVPVVSTGSLLLELVHNMDHLNKDGIQFFKEYEAGENPADTPVHRQTSLKPGARYYACPPVPAWMLPKASPQPPPEPAIAAARMDPKKTCYCGSEMGKGVCLDGASVTCKEMPEDRGPPEELEAAREIYTRASLDANNGMLPDRSDIAAIISKHFAPLRAELDAARERIAETEKALAQLESAASRVATCGATTGTQWIALNIALLRARAALAALQAGKDQPTSQP